MLGGLAEDFADALSSHADEDFVEIASVRAEKMGFGFAGDGFGEHRLAGSWRANEQNALG